MRTLCCVTLLLSACVSESAPSKPVVLNALERDLASYTMAKCLAFQEQPYLREQGERWADAVIQRGAGPIEAWALIAQAVRAELARSGIAMGRSERPVDPGVPLPVLTCGEIGDEPAVHKAVTQARSALAPDYKARVQTQ